DEAARLPRSAGVARRGAQAPLARRDWWLRHPRAGVQGHPDGRSHGWRALHRTEPDRAGCRPGEQPDADQGRAAWPARVPGAGALGGPEGGDGVTSVDVIGRDGSPAGSVELPADVFDAPVNTALMHQVVVAQLAAARQGTHKTKTRGEVRGGSGKPWRQKGTGRARHGSRRAPQWRGGGVVHGPVPRDYRQRTPKQMKAAALRGALSDRARGGRVHVVETFVDGETPSTKAALATLAKVSQAKRVLVVLDREDRANWLSLRNEPRVHLLDAGQLNTYDVLVSDDVVFTRAALEQFCQRASRTAKGEES